MTALPRKMRSVAWREVDGACEEIMLYQVRSVEEFDGVFHEHEAQLPLSGRQGSCFAGCFAQLPLLKLVTGLPGAEAGDMYMQGHVWKLSHKQGVSPTDIFNWRRRLAFVRQTKTETALAYISEKDNGNVHVSCILQQLEKKNEVKLRIDSPIALESLTKDAKDQVAFMISQYSIAIDDDATGMMMIQDHYVKEVPETLYPFTIFQEDKSITWALTNQDDFDYWMRKLDRFF
eukprot:CAMPEP_0197664560 /NCGR_PEP_ID=MMETSP1338-20131121/58713_1 /TAXON_ID=43686 ORGANISM="Pelagodinium beii, Strain RCC1491" /NCGR_SAMPLE_ID=MMETSP1338 /ASSEMBLY_ACC=CAM_ASM_000754 /LENGTH=231 /DNA_ID=CAMNT_0043243231 /DNA_START=12 /DNA_END=707 /DNA_ORIENTATION=-